jgi:hypothetical protein
VVVESYHRRPTKQWHSFDPASCSPWSFFVVCIYINKFLSSMQGGYIFGCCLFFVCTTGSKIVEPFSLGEDENEKRIERTSNPIPNELFFISLCHMISQEGGL